jgi:lysophospholipase L1-like esterase
MNRFFKYGISFLLLLQLGTTVMAQSFAADIASFQKKDSLNPPLQHEIVFVGSSSFTKWTDVQDYFPSYPIINRGFGGSTLVDVIRYEEQTIFKYNPKQVVIYCGENDVASADTITGEVVFERFKQLFTDIRNRFPGIPIIFISMKPSPSRWQMRERLMNGNERIRKYMLKKKKAKFISVWKSMLGPDGKPMPEIFIQDNLHMNAKGYAIWKKLIEPYLLK